MSNILGSALSSVSTVLGLGMDFGVNTAQTVGIFPLYTPYIASGSALNQSSANLGANGTVMGAPTITNSLFTINTPGTDYVSLPFGDAPNGAQNAPDFTAFVVATNLSSGFDLLSTYGPDPNNPQNTTTKGVRLWYNNATSIQFSDFHTVSGSTNQISLTLPVPNLLTAGAAFLFCIQRGTSGGVVTRNIFNLTASNTPNTYADSAGIAANNYGGKFLMGGTIGGQGGPASLAFGMMIQSAQAGGAFLSAAQVAAIGGKIRTQMAYLPTPLAV